MNTPHNRAQSSNQNKNPNAFADLLGPMAFAPATTQKPLSAIQPQAKSTQMPPNNFNSKTNQMTHGSGSNTPYMPQNVNQNSANLRQKVGNSLDPLGKDDSVPGGKQSQLQSSSTPTLLQSIPVRNTKSDTNPDPFSNFQLNGLQFNEKSQQPKLNMVGQMETKSNAVLNPSPKTPAIALTPQLHRNLEDSLGSKSSTVDLILKPPPSEPAAANTAINHNSNLIDAIEFEWENQPQTVQGNASNVAHDVFDVEFLGTSKKPAAILEDDILGILSLPVSSVKKPLDSLPNSENKPKVSNFDTNLSELISMGFERDLAAATLIENDENLQRTINHLIGINQIQSSPMHKPIKLESKAEGAIHSLVNMGFSYTEAEDALLSSNGDADKAVEILLGSKSEPVKKDAVSSATKIVGAIGMSVFKNAKSVFNASKQKVGEVLGDFNTNGNRSANNFSDRQEEEWAKSSFKDESTKREGSRTKEIPFTPVDNDNDDGHESSESPLKRSRNPIPIHAETQNVMPLLSFGEEEMPLKNINPIANVQKLTTAQPAKTVNVELVFATPEIVEKSNQIRSLGNDYFKKGQFGDAETEYTNAIAILPPKHNLLIPLYNNRAACRLKNGDNRGAVADCDIILKQDPNDIKALLRRATAFEALENWESARIDYRKLMGIDSNLKGVSIGLARSNAALQPKSVPVAKTPATVDDLFTAPKPVEKFVKKAVDEAVKKLRNSNEASEQMENDKFAASQTVNAKIDAWKKNKETNIRALLSSLELILWPECSWKPCNLGELISPAQVKGKYIRAVSKLHPDKLGPNCTIEQQLIASAVFTLLNKAWDSFKLANNL